ncbi:uncharacterized protein CEXT_516671 [Caerostris extrusa]|uniref:Gustatory receptor n=1 Tax=Caerostris extrusa TaxID=172846 RepID=A0AAV4PKX9_CAEEX|nr:uncharacterized protein CEXT_516671 [Caerostris extrusa]
MENVSPNGFSVPIQIEYLKQRNRIINVLEEIQEIFSTVSFVIITTNTLQCVSNLAQLIAFSSANTLVTVIEVLYISINATLSMISIFYNAGQVPKEIHNFSKILRSHYELKAFLGFTSENSLVERLVFEEKTFVLSGCELIFMKRQLFCRL